MTKVHEQIMQEMVSAEAATDVSPSGMPLSSNQTPAQENDARVGNHALPAQAAYVQKSARMRKILIGVIILLIVFIVVGTFLCLQMITAARDAAVMQSQITPTSTIKTSEEATKDSSATTSKKTAVPNLVSLLGKTQEEALTALQHGAKVTSSLPLSEEGNPVKEEVRIALTEEPADSRGGTPTVLISLDGSGSIIRAGYTTTTSSLGYGSLSFSDAIQNESIIEKTLAEAGVTVPLTSLKLPEDKMEYSTYASDGTTLTKESYTFSGNGSAEGSEIPWSGTLSYDYTMANATGNLVDTIRTIYVYVG